MHIEIICPGSVHRPYLREGIADYLRRLRRYVPLSITEVPEARIRPGAGAAEVEKALAREGGEILRRLKPDTFVAVLDERGQTMTSTQLAHWLTGLSAAGIGRVVLVLGSARGLAPEVSARADFKLSLSPMTFPHELARLLLLEQLYRAFKINLREPYHY